MGTLTNLDKFHVVTVISNPYRYKSRFNLYEIFDEDITKKGAKLWTVEMATGRRSHSITNPENPHHIQVWSSSLPGELWHKENLINVAIQQLTIRCPDWRYVAWVDADIKFERGMLDETAQMLQHWDVVQMWSHSIDFGPAGELVGKPQMSYMYCYWHNIIVESKNAYTRGGHPGFAWAARREAINKLGGLIDWGVLGSGDRHMACALTGKVAESHHGEVHPNYEKWLQIWQDRSENNIRRNVGYVPGTIRHMWHGRKAQRGYSSRWRILVDHQFNPETDIKKDSSGLWQLVSESPRQVAMRDAIRKYFRARNEDSIDV